MMEDPPSFTCTGVCWAIKLRPLRPSSGLFAAYQPTRSVMPLYQALLRAVSSNDFCVPTSLPCASLDLAIIDDSLRQVDMSRDVGCVGCQAHEALGVSKTSLVLHVDADPVPSVATLHPGHLLNAVGHAVLNQLSVERIARRNMRDTKSTMSGAWQQSNSQLRH